MLNGPFIAIVIISILSACELDLFVPSISEIRHHFGASEFQVELLMSCNFIFYCISCLFAGSLGDRFGRKITSAFGIALFIVGSLLCVFSDNFLLLLLGRCIQGVGVSVTMLAYVIIADNYKLQDQQRLMGYVNAISAVTLSLAPVIGSWLGFYFGWRSNFIALLLLGIVSLYFTIFHIKADRTYKNIPLIAGYIPLLKDKKAWLFILFSSTLGAPYWSYVAITPILFVEDLGVDLKMFGFYQGANALVFGLLSFICMPIIERVGERRIQHITMPIVVVCMFSVLVMGLFGVNNALYCTIASVIWGAAIVFPITISYPYALVAYEGDELNVDDIKGRMSSLIQAARLIISAISIQAASYFYDGTVLPIATAMVVSISFAYLLFLIICKKRYM